MTAIPYKTIVFDCDGVLLNSNKIKTQAFYDTVSIFGHEKAQKLVDFHKENGGISRNKKFQYFLDNIVQNNTKDLDLNYLLTSYAELVLDGLKSCEICNGLDVLRNENPDSRWLVVSGGNEYEIKEVFKMRGIKEYFEGGIYGSPKSKDDIFKKITKEDNFKFPALYLGDSRYDHQVSTKYLLDFIFIYGWTEFYDWKDYCSKNMIPTVERLSDISSYFSQQ